MKRSVRNTVKRLRQVCPLNTPVRVVSQSLEDTPACGFCTAYYNAEGELNRFIIVINTDLCEQAELDTVLHEWAHALDIERNGVGRNPHRRSWGVAFAQVWNCFFAT